MDINSAGYLKIGNEADRNTVASILFNNGYSVKKVRRKKNGKTYEYYVAYEEIDMDDMPTLGGDGNEG